jgi:hypothetical protein
MGESDFWIDEHVVSGSNPLESVFLVWSISANEIMGCFAEQHLAQDYIDWQEKGT